MYIHIYNLYTVVYFFIINTSNFVEFTKKRNNTQKDVPCSSFNSDFLFLGERHRVYHKYFNT